MPLKTEHIINSKISKELKDFLDEKVFQYNQTSFIEEDPISIPHRYTKKQDIEIAGFLAAIIAWGQRKTILNNANKLMDWMDDAPHDFILNHKKTDLKKISTFVHRTFNGTDILFFIESLKRLYTKKDSLEHYFLLPDNSVNTQQQIVNFRNHFIKNAPGRTLKHISNPDENSAAKRINMYLRWMVRNDKNKVDFGIWKNLKPSQLVCPLDVHSGTVARKLGLLQRTQNDWKAAEELTVNLRLIDKYDPVKYDFALFGLGVYKEI
ncbi:MAG: TIGR02757 family protein [Bacteroidota bacterium]